MFLIFVVFISSGFREAIAIWSFSFREPSYKIDSRKVMPFSFFISKTTPFVSSLRVIFSFRNFCESAAIIARISEIPSPVSAEHGTTATFCVKSFILLYSSALNP